MIRIGSGGPLYYNYNKDSPRGPYNQDRAPSKRSSLKASFEGCYKEYFHKALLLGPQSLDWGSGAKL